MNNANLRTDIILHLQSKKVDELSGQVTKLRQMYKHYLKLVLK